MPHAHIVICVNPEYAPTTAERIDLVISAQMPGDDRPVLQELVRKFMVHSHNAKSPCCARGRCKYHYPFEPQAKTVVQPGQFPLYKRNQGDEFIVAYNTELLEMFECHIHVVACGGGTSSMGYLFRYIYKGNDHATFTALDVGDDDVDVIMQWKRLRCLTACEAAWRMIIHNMSYRRPAAQAIRVTMPRTLSWLSTPLSERHIASGP